MSVFRRLWESIRRGGDLLTEQEKAYGVYPDVDFELQMQVYLAHPTVRANIDFLADNVARGFYTTMNEEYEETTPDGAAAKEVVDEFNENVNMDLLLQEGAKWIIGMGNLFWKRSAPKLETLENIPIECIKDVKFEQDGKTPKFYELKYPIYGKQIPADEVIHLPYCRLTRKPFGIGLLYTLCISLDVGNGERRDPFYQIIGKTQQAMAEQIIKWSAANELWIMPGVKDLSAVHGKIKTLPKSGARFTTDIKDARVQTIVAERMRGLDLYAELLWNELFLALETPLSKLFTSPGFTEASARAAVDAVQYKVGNVQRFLKREIERKVFDVVVAEAGLLPDQAQVRLNWGMEEAPDIEPFLEIALETWLNGGMMTSEWRKVLIKLGLPLEEVKKPEEVATVIEKEAKIREAFARHMRRRWVVEQR